jgi:hypothetical protein
MDTIRISASGERRPRDCTVFPVSQILALLGHMIAYFGLLPMWRHRMFAADSGFHQSRLPAIAILPRMIEETGVFASQYTPFQ